MSFAVVIEGMTLITYMVILAGGVQKRANGWKILSTMLLLVGAVQLAVMSIMVSVFEKPFIQHSLEELRQSPYSSFANGLSQAYLYDNDDRFFPGWKLDKSWILCTVSASVAIISASGIIASALTLPSEGGYELIPDREQED